jgi:uncharacterized coiled-coil protein SlyX
MRDNCDGQNIGQFSDLIKQSQRSIEKVRSDLARLKHRLEHPEENFVYLDRSEAKPNEDSKCSRHGM